MPARHQRTQARKAAIQLLYSGELTATLASEIIETGVTPEESGEIDTYARTLIAGVEDHMDEIDAIIDEHSQNWAITRMPIVDKSILRMAIFEMLYVEYVPAGVSINEAVDLAKAFGGEDDSHRFVNGILGSVAKTLEKTSEEGTVEDAE